MEHRDLHAQSTRTIDTSENLDRLTAYVRESTVPYRKGEVVEAKADIGTLTVVTIDDFPALPTGSSPPWTCHFVNVGFTEALASHEPPGVLRAGHRRPHGRLPDMAPETTGSGPSYIESAAGSVTRPTPSRFMACCQAHGLGDVITPAGCTSSPGGRDLMAGNGYILLSGLTTRPPR